MFTIGAGNTVGDTFSLSSFSHFAVKTSPCSDLLSVLRDAGNFGIYRHFTAKNRVKHGAFLSITLLT